MLILQNLSCLAYTGGARQDSACTTKGAAQLPDVWLSTKLDTMKSKLIIGSFCLLTLAACTKHEPLTRAERTIIHCIENMPFECRIEPPQWASFFRADINGQTYCVSTADEHYSFRVTSVSGHTTPASAPALQPGSPAVYRSVGFRLGPQLRHSGIVPYAFLPHVSLGIPNEYDTTSHPRHYYVDKYLPRQGDLPLKEQVFDEEGFYLDVSWSCYHLPNYEYHLERSNSPGEIPFETVSFQSRRQSGSRNVRLWVEHFEREELSDYDIYYRIVFRFEGSFGYLNIIVPNLEIRDGVYDINFILPKEE